MRYDSATHWINSSPGEDVAKEPPPEEFSPFRAETHDEPVDVPPLHLDYLERQKERGELALGFVFVPPVLVAGPIDISGLELIEL